MESEDYITLDARIDGLGNTGDTIVREVSMVGQRIQTRARSTTVMWSRWLESMVAMNIYELLLNVQYTLQIIPLQ